MARCTDIPEDFIAANSQFSAKLPKVIIEAKTTDNGNTKGIILGILNNKNFIIIIKSKSLPASSDIKSQTT